MTAILISNRDSQSVPSRWTVKAIKHFLIHRHHRENLSVWKLKPPTQFVKPKAASQ